MAKIVTVTCTSASIGAIAAAQPPGSLLVALSPSVLVPRDAGGMTVAEYLAVFKVGEGTVTG